MLKVRVFRLFVLAAALAVPGIARAQVVVGLYPVQGKIEPRFLSDAEGLIVSGVRDSDRRRGAFILRGPVPLKAACEPTVTTECLARLGRGGAILYAEAAMDGGAVSVSLSLITGQQQRTPPVHFRFTPGFVDQRPAHFAVEQLEKSLADLTRPTASNSVAPGVASPSPQAKAHPAAEAQPAPITGTPTAVATADASKEDALEPAVQGGLDEQAAPSSSKWMRTTGIYASMGGAVLLGTGGFFGLRSRAMNKDLSRRYSEGRLVPGDHSKFGQVKTYNTLANTLMIGGGIVALTGLSFWGLSGVSFDSDGQGGGNISVRGRW
ncbi:hypothetical protein JGU66_32020 [Myxococcaceae bacterium JPH2]|nr:hypothetical protein [Myxococcaceae bacterium JPH2]